MSVSKKIHPNPPTIIRGVRRVGNKYVVVHDGDDRPMPAITRPMIFRTLGPASTTQTIAVQLIRDEEEEEKKTSPPPTVISKEARDQFMRRVTRRSPPPSPRTAAQDPDSDGHTLTDDASTVEDVTPRPTQRRLFQ